MKLFLSQLHKKTRAIIMNRWNHLKREITFWKVVTKIRIGIRAMHLKTCISFTLQSASLRISTFSCTKEGVDNKDQNHSLDYQNLRDCINHAIQITSKFVKLSNLPSHHISYNFIEIMERKIQSEVLSLLRHCYVICSPVSHNSTLPCRQ